VDSTGGISGFQDFPPYAFVIFSHNRISKMQEHIIEYVFVILIILGLVMLANKLKVAYPIVLVLGGLALSFTGIFNNITIDPELIFFIFLPPLLYESAWQVTWNDFWKWRRVILSFAFPIVILTSCVVALASYALIPGFTLALGFLLGGIVSPPDAISSSTIMRQVKVPKRLLSIVEGESLLNDASSLIVFRFAMAAVITGQFHFSEAAGSFFLVIVVGTAIGLLIGGIFYAMHRWLPTTPSIEIVLSLLAPYCMYYFAERFHFSGVLAVVAGGLLLSSRRQEIHTYQGRVQGSNVWSTLGFVLNGIVFMLIGLELPAITSQMGDVSITEATFYGLIISLVLIVARLLCAMGASVFTRFMSHYITVADASPGWRLPFVFGWAGMRGVVSLAAALSIPVMMSETEAFPYRNLILFITFIVILVTLVFQGLTLPWVIKKANPAFKNPPLSEHEQEKIIQRRITETSIDHLTKYSDDHPLAEQIANLRKRLEMDLKAFDALVEVTDEEHPRNAYLMAYLELLEQQRHMLTDMNHHAEVDEELIRKYLTLVDIEEFKVREKMLKAD
jgi:monovalent cation/hydrogen antiporter